MATTYNDIHLLGVPTLECSSNLSRLSAFWGVLPIALNTMSQPSGRVLGYPSSYNFVLRSSPLVCAVNTIDTLIRLAVYTNERKSLKRGLKDVIDYRFEDRPGDEDGSFTSLRKNTPFRIALFGLGALPQVIKIFAVTGIPWTKAWCALFLASFVVDEILMLITSPLSQSRLANAPIASANQGTSRRNIWNELFEHCIVVLNSLIVFAFFTHSWLDLTTMIDDKKQRRDKITIILMTIVSWLGMAGFGFQKLDELDPRSMALLLAAASVVALLYILSSAVLGFWNPNLIILGWLPPYLGTLGITTTIYMFPQLYSPRRKHAYVILTLFYSIFNLAVVAWYYRLAYKPETTCKPSWTNILG